ncbi:enoyl-CoA hydratase-related protein [Rhodococcus sp. NPDC057014]|uniref:enoyl-CoA hydratase-related protein n=1 Tax=Rhodococcus sp. NPDC057014 TaxID=3346000 RepID=UPI00363514D9
MADQVATITLNRPAARNGFTLSMADELGAAMRTADADSGVGAVVLTGAGANFCVGMDMTEGESGTEDHTAPDWVEPAARVARPMYRMNKPVIAAIRGAAIGVGSTMILPADFRICSRDARFGYVFARRGLFPEGGSLWFLPRIVGLGTAKDWMITGRIIDATEALAAGLVTAVYETDDLLRKAYELARELIATTAPVSVAVIRRALVEMTTMQTPDAAFALDAKLISHAFSSADSVEGISSFLERRAPQFTGRTDSDLPGFLPWASGAAVSSG